MRTAAAGGYASHRFLLGGAPVSRYVSVLLVLLALVWLTGLLPGRWIGVALFISLAVVHMIYGRTLARRDYVKFEPTPLPDGTLTKLDSAESLPVYVTGALSVEGHEQRFTFLPGFYRTFATREHALLCQARQRKAYKVLHWPIEQVGMWYAFIRPPDIRRIQWGVLQFTPDPIPTIAITYDLRKVAQNRLRRTPVENHTAETIYLSSTDLAMLQRIVADLQADDIAQAKHNPADEEPIQENLV